MAETPPPSPRYWIEHGPQCEDWPDPQHCELVPAGRLVDWEAIDYVKGRDAGRLVDDRIVVGESNENEIDVVMAIVDAALPEV